MGLVTLVLLFSSTTQTFDLPKGLLSALCYVESAHNIHALNKDDGTSSSLGICEIKLATAKLMGFKGNEKDLMNPVVNIHYAGKYLKKQLVRYHGDVKKAVAAYNAGTYRENKNGLVMNRQYVGKVFKAWLKNK